MPKDESPHVTIRRMADYLTAPGAHQRLTIIHSMKSRLGKRRFAPFYQVSRNAIRAYHSGENDILEHEVQRLLRERREAIKPSDLTKIDNNLRVLTDYIGSFADEDVAHVNGRFDPLMVNGVRITVEPTLSGQILAGKQRFHANILIDTQAAEPNDDEIDYVLELLHRGSGATRPAPPKGAQYWHPSSGGSWYLNRSSKRRWQDIQDAAAEIALRWPTIQV
jgi:hypothetical protein